MSCGLVTELTFIIMLMSFTFCHRAGAVLGMLLTMTGVTVCVLSSVSQTDIKELRNTSDH